MDMLRKVWSDTAIGAIDMLKDHSSCDLGPDPTAQPDPVHEGVWLVTATTGEKAIVYLAGYPTYPHGPTREVNDFECEEDMPCK
jgi:hypothetical protein